MAVKIKDLATYLKTKRVEAGLTQRQVSDFLKYDTPQFVSNWERGVSAPPVDSLRALAKFYKVDAEEMFEVLLEHSLEQTTNDLRRKFKAAR